VALAAPIWLLVAAACGDDRDALGPAPADAGAAGPDARDASFIPVRDAEAAPDAGPVDTGADGGAAPDGAVDAGPPAPLAVDVDIEVPADKPLQARIVITANHPATATVELTGPGVARTYVRSAPMTEHEIRVVQLRQTTAYDVVVTARAPGDETAFETTTFRTGALQLTSRMNWSVVVNEPSRVPGLTLFNVFGPNPEYVAVDAEGHIVWHWIDTGGRAEGLGLIIRQLDAGTFLVRAEDGMRVIDAWGDSLRFYPDTRNLGLGFHHDAVFVPDGNLLVMNAERRSAFVPALGGQVDLLADTVIELDPMGQLVRTWRAFDALDPSRFPGPMSRQTLGIGYDWSHGNTIHYRARDDSYLVSLRNQSWVVKVDRTSGQVQWILGEGGNFTLEEGTWFNGQHTPSWLGDSEIMIYDNGVELTPQVSRAVVYAIDEENLTARQTWSWQVPFYTGAVGDVDRIGPHWLITAGTGTPTIFEIDDVGNIIWQLEADRGSIYRAERIDAITLE
jgi:hypothetical protein